MPTIKLIFVDTWTYEYLNRKLEYTKLKITSTSLLYEDITLSNSSDGHWSDVLDSSDVLTWHFDLLVWLTSRVLR